MMVKVFIHGLDCFLDLGQLKDTIVVIIFTGKSVTEPFLNFTKAFHGLLLHLNVGCEVGTFLGVRIDLVGTNQRVQAVNAFLLRAGCRLIKNNFTALLGLHDVSCQLLRFWRLYTKGFKFDFEFFQINNLIAVKWLEKQLRYVL